MRKMRRMLMVTAGALLLLGLPGGGAPAHGEGDTGLFGYGVGATATAISTIYNQPSFGVPTDPTFELRKVYSVAVLDSGPSARALGTVLWPGDVVGNAPPSLAFDTLVFNPTRISQLDEALTELKTNLSQNTEGSPPYPVRSESFFPPGESDESDIAAGAGMSSLAREDLSQAASTSGRQGVPGVIFVGSLESFSKSSVGKGTAVSEAWSRITGLDLFGAIHVDSIYTSAKSVSDGVKAKVEGAMQIAGLTIKNPATGEVAGSVIVDKTGFHLGDTTEDPLGTLAAALFDKYLTPQGISLSVGSPVDLIEGPAGSRAITGLTFRLDSFGMKKLMDGLPPEVRQQILAPNAEGSVLKPLFDNLLSPSVAGLIASMFQGDQTIQFVFGGSAVSTIASPEIAFPDIPVPEVPPFLPPGITPPIDFGPGGTTTLPPPTGGGGSFLAPRPVAVVGVPAGLLGLVILLGLAGSRGLRRLADGMTAGRTVVRCPLEENR
jgi:hypothetical protein